MLGSSLFDAVQLTMSTAARNLYGCLVRVDCRTDFQHKVQQHHCRLQVAGLTAALVSASTLAKKAA